MNDIRSRTVEKYKAATYLHKAASFLSGIQSALEEEEWNLAGLLAIHSTINSADAVTVHYLGLRCASERHEDVVRLLGSTGAPGAAEKCRQVLEVLQFKSLIEYSPDEPSEGQAREMAKIAERINRWAVSAVQ